MGSVISDFLGMPILFAELHFRIFCNLHHIFWYNGEDILCKELRLVRRFGGRSKPVSQGLE